MNDWRNDLPRVNLHTLKAEGYTPPRGKGGIYTRERCPLCGDRFIHIEPRGIFCLNHKEKISPTSYAVKYPPGIYRRFSNYQDAYRFLINLRYQTDHGTFDERDFRADMPLGFANLANQYLEKKRRKVRCFRNLHTHMAYAIDAWGNRNIKSIQYADLEDFFDSSALAHLSDKSRANIRATLHAFWQWLRRRRVLTRDQVPEFPEITYKLGWRNTVSKGTQEAILAESKRISWHINPKIWIGHKWLCTYYNLRPIELTHLQEKDFNYDEGVVTVWYKKTKEPELVFFLPEDLELAKSFGPAFPELYFFRHMKGIGGVTPGSRFGPKYLYKWWKKACKNLGIEGLDLYGGTRHSSVRALAEKFTPEQIKRVGWKTNKAFERYLGPAERDETHRLYQSASRGVEKAATVPLPLKRGV